MSKAISRRRFLTTVSGSLIGLWTTPAFAASGAKTLAVRLWPASAYTRITVETDQVARFKSFSLTNPSRLVVDFSGSTNAVLNSLPNKVLPRDPYIRNIRVGQFDPQTVRIVIDLKTQINPQIFTLPPVANFKNRLVIDLYPAAAAAQDADPLLALLQEYGSGRKLDDTPRIVRNDTPRGKKRRPVVVLDPGHGGEDPGAIAASGLREKDVVLSIAREAKKQLDAMGYTTYMTRNEDIFIPLGVRVSKARRLKADVFVSIHADAFTKPTARGTGVYALSEKGATSAAAKYLARTQNDADLIGGVRLSRNPVINSTLIDLAQNATINDSLKLGSGLLKELEKINKLHKGHVDQANFAVLRAPDIPSVLVETAFLSNPIEAALLADNGFRRQAAQAIAAGVRGYLSTAILAQR